MSSSGRETLNPLSAKVPKDHLDVMDIRVVEMSRRRNVMLSRCRDVKMPSMIDLQSSKNQF